jgi:RNA recognition motif-containing protein
MLFPEWEIIVQQNSSTSPSEGSAKAEQSFLTREYTGLTSFSRSSLSSFVSEDFENSDVSGCEGPQPKTLMTTVMIRNLPGRYTQKNLSDEVSVVNTNFDFLYMPPSSKTGGNKGFAFVNFRDEESASMFKAEFDGRRFGKSSKNAEVIYAEMQGLAKNIKFYKRCKAIKARFQPYIAKDVFKTLKSLEKLQKSSEELRSE